MSFTLDKPAERLGGNCITMAQKTTDASADNSADNLDISGYSGQSDMAAGILHNVCNILTPVIGIISQMGERINETPMEKIDLTVKELEKGDVDPQRALSLNRYLLLRSSEIISLVRETGSEIKGISRRLDQIAVILKNRKSASYPQAFRETLNIQKLAFEAFDLLPSSFKSLTSFEIDSKIDFLPEIIGERAVWVQIFYNVLKNAAESVLSYEGSWGYIHVSGTLKDIDGIETIHLTIEDNGRGIDRELLESIFEPGYSQKGPDHSGLGLHWCKKVLAGLNGKLYAESEGIGRGACFHMDFPLAIN